MQKPYIISTTFPAPLDDRQVATSVASIAAELPAALRFEGLLVYCQLEGAYYAFYGGVSDAHFKPAFGGGAPAYALTANAYAGFEIQHGLGRLPSAVQFASPGGAYGDCLWAAGRGSLLPPLEAEAAKLTHITIYPGVPAVLNIYIY